MNQIERGANAGYPLVSDRENHPQTPIPPTEASKCEQPASQGEITSFLMETDDKVIVGKADVESQQRGKEQTKPFTARKEASQKNRHKDRPRNALLEKDLNFAEIGADDLVKLHIEEIKSRQSSPEQNFKLAAHIFVGQLALKALEEIRYFKDIAPSKKKKIADILEDKKAKFLSNQFDLNFISIKKRLTEGGGRIRRGDSQFVEIEDKHHKRIIRQIEMIQAVDTDQQRKLLFQKMIDRQIELVERGKQAFDSLVENNLSLSVYWANRFACEGLSFSDRLSYAQEGLMIAAARFDFRRKWQFATYATWWIKRKIEKAITDYGSTIRLPGHIHEDYLRKFKKVEEKLVQRLGRSPTIEEVAQELGLREEKLADIFQIYGVSSLNRLVVEDQDTELISLRADERLQDPQDEVIKTELKATMRKFLATLSRREQEVLVLRYGIKDGHERSLGEVGKELNVSRQRVHQLETKALERLRQPLYTSELRYYLDGWEKASVNGRGRLGSNKKRLDGRDK